MAYEKWHSAVQEIYRARCEAAPNLCHIPYGSISASAKVPNPQWCVRPIDHPGQHASAEKLERERAQKANWADSNRRSRGAESIPKRANAPGPCVPLDLPDIDRRGLLEAWEREKAAYAEKYATFLRGEGEYPVKKEKT